MVHSSAQDRELPASQRRIDKSRTDGQVARSRDLGHFAALTAGVALLAFLAPDICISLGGLLAQSQIFDAGPVGVAALYLRGQWRTKATKRPPKWPDLRLLIARPS
jgi:flagellar biosynthetic protein FlhB